MGGDGGIRSRENSVLILGECPAPLGMMSLTRLVFVSHQLGGGWLTLLLRGDDCPLLWLVVEQELPGDIALIEMVQLIQDCRILEDKLQDGQFDEAIELKPYIVSRPILIEIPLQCTIPINKDEKPFDKRQNNY